MHPPAPSSHSCDEIQSFFGLLIKHSHPHFLIFQISMSVWRQALVPMNNVWIPQALTSVSPARKVFEAGTDNVLVGNITLPLRLLFLGGENEIYGIHVILRKVFNHGECKKMSWLRGHKVPKGTNSSDWPKLSLVRFLNKVKQNDRDLKKESWRAKCLKTERGVYVHNPSYLGIWSRGIAGCRLTWGRQRDFSQTWLGLKLSGIALA